jgi:uncharacterized protein YdaU (DUF1376 family)
MTTANSLHWFPRDPAKELARTAGLEPEAHSAYVRLRDQAWLAHEHGEQPCTLANDEGELARLSGLSLKSWRRVAPSILRFLNVVGTRLVDADLLKLWEEQQRKYDRRKNAGGKGGRAKADTRKQSSSIARTKPQQLEQELEAIAPKGANSRSQFEESPYAPAPEGARDGGVDEEPVERGIRNREGAGLSAMPPITSILIMAGIPKPPSKFSTAEVS